MAVIETPFGEKWESWEKRTVEVKCDRLFFSSKRSMEEMDELRKRIDVLENMLHIILGPRVYMK